MTSKKEGNAVLVAVSDSPDGHRALEWAVRNTNVINGNDTLHLLVVTPPPSPSPAAALRRISPGLQHSTNREESRKRAEQEADAILSRARDIVLKIQVKSLPCYLFPRSHTLMGDIPKVSSSDGLRLLGC